MPGNMTKAKASEWLAKHGTTVRGYPQEPAAAYLGLGVKRFRDSVAAGCLPQPQRHGRRLSWDKAALDAYMNRAADIGSAKSLTTDPIMASIHAAQPAQVRSGDQS